MRLQESDFTDSLGLKISRLKAIQHDYVRVYGRYELDKSLLWMIEEAGEVVSAIRKAQTKNEIAGEIGDLLTWVFNLCNILEIDIAYSLKTSLDKEVARQERKYGKLKYFHA